MVNVQHGPYKGGKNKQRIKESAEFYAMTATNEDFQNLLDLMLADRCLEDTDEGDETLPHDKSDIPSLNCVTTLPPYVT